MSDCIVYFTCEAYEAVASTAPTFKFVSCSPQKPKTVHSHFAYAMQVQEFNPLVHFYHLSSLVHPSFSSVNFGSLCCFYMCIRIEYFMMPMLKCRVGVPDSQNPRCERSRHTQRDQWIVIVRVDVSICYST